MSQKILYVITKSNFGGAQRYVFDLASAAKKAGFEVAVALGGEGLLQEKLQTEGISVFQIQSLERNINPLLDLQACTELYRLFQREKPDSIHLNSSKIGVIGALAGRFARIPTIIFTAHGWAFNDPRLSRVMRLLAYPAHWLTVQVCTRTITVSQATNTQIAHLPFVKRKLITIPNGIPPLSFLSREKARETIFQKINTQDTDVFLLGTLAELHPVKGLHYLIKSVVEIHATHPTIRVVIFGEGEEKEKLKEQIKKFGLEQVIFLPGFHADSPTLLRGFDAFILPSLSEALSYSVLEAGAAGRPIIASEVGGLPEIIEHRETGLLITPRNIEEIKTAIVELMEDDSLRDKLGRNIERRVHEHFSLEKMTKETMRLYMK